MTGFSTYTCRAIGSTALVATTSGEALATARVELVKGLRELDLACSRFRDDSELTALNRSAGEPVRIGKALWGAIEAALESARATDGLVDPTVGAALRGIGYDRTFSRLAARNPDSVPVRFVAAGGWRSIEVDPDSRSVRVPPGVELDLGATAKAFAADRIAERIARRAGCGVLVSVGGDIATAGEMPDGGWPVELSDDHRSAAGHGPVVGLVSRGLATSSTTVRRWRTATGDAHHIVDPKTGAPVVSRWRTISVAAASCLDANTAATAALVLSGDAPEWLECRSLPSRLVRRDGSIVAVCGWPADQSAAA